MPSATRVSLQSGDGLRTQRVWGGRLLGPDIFEVHPDETLVLLGSEITHGGRRVRSWIWAARVPTGGAAGSWLPGADRPMDLLLSLMQPRHHRSGGAVTDLLAAVERGVAQNQMGQCSAAWWLAAGVSAAAGQGVRLPAIPGRGAA